MGGEPSFHLRMFMGGVVVNDEVNVKIIGDILINMLDKTQIFLVTMPMFALGDHLSIGDVKCSEERCGTMAYIVMGHAFDVAKAHRKQRLGAVQGLNLAFFVNTQHERFVRRVEVEPDNIAHFLHKERVCGKFEMPLSVRLKSERMPDATNRRVRHPRFALLGKSAKRPLATIFGLGGKGLTYQKGNSFISESARFSRTQLVMQAFDAHVQVPCSPFAHRRLAHA